VRHAAVLLLALASAAHSQTQHFDVVVYGGTAAGAMAAIAAAREGLKTAIIEPGRHLGGMTTGGLSHTDVGKPETIGGLALEFYKRVGQKYNRDLAFDFEPHIAEAVLTGMVQEAGVKLFFDHRLREESAVDKWRGRVKEIYCWNATSFTAKVFIDASYEGDLLKLAGITFKFGRESSNEHGEGLAGVRPKDRGHQFDFPVPAIDEAKNLLPDIWGSPREPIGRGDNKVPSYNFRLCLSSESANQTPFPKPANYRPDRYELLLRYIAEFQKYYGRLPKIDGDLFTFFPLPGSKVDVNNHGPISTDLINASWDYPIGNYQRRAEIWQDHLDWTAGLFWFLANEERVPQEIRTEIGKWGLAADEFADNDNWPRQLYIRESRRIVGEYVMTQNDLERNRRKPDAIAIGSYAIDSHNVQRFRQPDDTVQNEGNFRVEVEPYQIPFRALLPKRKQASNLITPISISATHVAYSSLRMEPVYMMMGHAAGLAARMAISGNVALHDIDVKGLAEKLRAQGAVLDLPGATTK
jgi:hypothetical protein